MLIFRFPSGLRKYYKTFFLSLYCGLSIEVSISNPNEFSANDFEHFYLENKLFVVIMHWTGKPHHSTKLLHKKNRHNKIVFDCGIIDVVF